jgi:succinate dehydrogenase / fumarate reductase flavoprotein subunit
MGGIRVDSETQMSTTVPGLFAAGECAAGINGANRLGGNSLSDLLVFGKRAGEHAARFAKENQAGPVDNSQVEEAASASLEPFDRAGAQGENPYQVQSELQVMMQDLVGIVRREEEMMRALDGIQELWKRARNVAAQGNREYNPGWHTALDLENLLTVSEAITRSALERKESRGAQFREDYPNKETAFAKINIVLRRGSDGEMILRREPLPEMPDYLKQVVQEMK